MRQKAQQLHNKKIEANKKCLVSCHKAINNARNLGPAWPQNLHKSLIVDMLHTT